MTKKYRIVPKLTINRAMGELKLTYALEEWSPGFFWGGDWINVITASDYETAIAAMKHLETEVTP